VNGTTAYVSLAGIAQFDVAIKTAQYGLNGSRLTGNFRVSGVQANGVVDGLAFGLFWRDAQGFHILRSNSATRRRRPATSARGRSGAGTPLAS
jgi:hypothetical protein